MSHLGDDLPGTTNIEAIVFNEPRRNPFAAWPVRLAIHAVAAVALVASGILAMSTGSFVPLWLGLGVLAAAEGVWLYFHLRR